MQHASANVKHNLAQWLGHPLVTHKLMSAVFKRCYIGAIRELGRIDLAPQSMGMAITLWQA